MDVSSLKSERCWLIRSSAKVIGPYSMDEVISLLMTKQVSLIDEVCQPSSRWSYIREHQAFLEFVKAIRNETDAMSEKTFSATTQTISRGDDAIDDELTPTPVSGSELRFSTLGTDIKDVTNTGYDQNVKSRRAVKKFGSLDDQKIQTEVNSTSNFLRVIALIVLVIFVGFAVHLVIKRDQQKSGAIEDSIAKAVRYKSLGLYERALTEYKKTQPQNHPNIILDRQMAALLMLEENQNILARRIYEKSLLIEGLSRQDSVENYIGLAISYMLSSEYKEAESFLQKAATFEPNNSDIKTNLGLVYLYSNKFIEAANEFDTLTKKFPANGYLQIFRTVAWLKQEPSENRKMSLEAIAKDLDQIAQQNLQFTQKINFLLVVIADILRDNALMQKSLERFLISPVLVGNDFKKPMGFDSKVASWDYLQAFCSDISSNLAAKSHLFKAICMLETNRDDETAKLLNQAQSEAPKLIEGKILQSSYLIKLHKLDEAKVLLSMPEMANIPPAKLMLGQICLEQQKWQCARESFEAVLLAEPRNVFAIYGAALSTFRMGNKQSAYNQLAVGMQLNPDYVPMIELREQLESL